MLFSALSLLPELIAFISLFANIKGHLGWLFLIRWSYIVLLTFPTSALRPTTSHSILRQFLNGYNHSGTLITIVSAFKLLKDDWRSINSIISITE